MWKVTKDKQGLFRAALYARNGNEIAHTTKGYSTREDIENVIETVKNKQYFTEYEVANVKVNGHAYFFTVFTSDGSSLLVSTVYKSEGHRNTRNQARISTERGIKSIDRYASGKIALDI